MRNSERGRTVFVVAALAAVVVACGSGPGAEAENPPPYQGAAELELGATHGFGEGHTVTVHQVVHRQVTTIHDQEVQGLAAEVEVCAGDAEINSTPSDFQLYQVTRYEMGDSTQLLHSTNGPSSVGFREPVVGPRLIVSPGECLRGWVDFLDVYGDHGEPTRVGFRGADRDTADAVWPAEEG